MFIKIFVHRPNIQSSDEWINLYITTVDYNLLLKKNTDIHYNTVEP